MAITIRKEKFSDFKRYQHSDQDKYDEAKNFLESICKCEVNCSKCEKHLVKPREIELKMMSDKGDVKSQFDLAEIFKHNKCYCHEEQAYQHYSMAAKQGHPEAQFKLGSMFLHGPDGDIPGFRKNKETAYNWFVHSAINGNNDARFILKFDYKISKIEYERFNESTGEKTNHVLDCMAD
jgi:TPR repeat protein